MSPHLNIATLLTWFRIAAIPLVVIVFYLPYWWARPAAALVFGLAAITDWLDGYLARRLDLTSQFGAFLDPVADKLMVTTALVIIVEADPRIVVALTAAIIIGRELTVSALREWMAELGARSKVAVSGFGKLKTIMQMSGLGAMLWTRPTFGLPIYDIGTALLILAAGLTLWSMFIYLRAAWPRLTQVEESS
jgi:CDP-diacylglycerol--glycerol-3-phosphate 3-phosphatidyltransferase